MKLAFALSVLLAATAFAQGESRPRAVIMGAVTDTALRPIAGAEVAIAGSPVHISTDSLGRFRIINVPAGRFVLMARSIGRSPAANLIEVGANDTLNLAFTLESSAQMLSTVVVTERSLSKRMAGFEARRKSGLGQFLTHEDLENKNAFTLVDALRTVPGIRINPSPMGGSIASSTRGISGCPLQVYLDGMPMSGANGKTMDAPFDLSYLPPANQIAAVEIYATSIEFPPQLAPQLAVGWSGCGGMFVWTTSG